MFQKQMDEDILMRRRFSISADALSHSYQSNEMVYVDPEVYYFPWYFLNQDISIYQADGTRFHSSPTRRILNVDKGELNLSSETNLSSLINGLYVSSNPYEALGITTNRDLNPATGKLDFGNELYKNDTKILTMDDNRLSISQGTFKTSTLYKFLHAQALPFHRLFEMEMQSGGGLYDPAVSVDGSPTLWAAAPESGIRAFGQKQRIHPLDFVDILEFHPDRSTNGNTVTSQEVWADLYKLGFIDPYGNFTKLFADVLVSGRDATKIALLVEMPYSVQFDAIVDRIFSIFSIDAYQRRALDFDSKNPQLFARAHPDLKSNGYVDIFGNQDLTADGYNVSDDGYNFLRDQFESGPTESEKAATDASNDAASDGAKAGEEGFEHVRLTHWGVYDDTCTIGSNAATIQEVRYYLADVLTGTEQLFFSDHFILTKSHQTVFSKQAVAARSSGDKANEPVPLPTNYQENIGKSFGFLTLYGFANPDFDKDYNSSLKVRDEDFRAPVSAASPGADLRLSPTVSVGYSYDYGISHQLPYDQRIISKATENKKDAYGTRIYENQGPDVIGEIAYIHVDDMRRGLNLNDQDDQARYQGTYSVLFRLWGRIIVRLFDSKTP